MNCENIIDAKIRNGENLFEFFTKSCDESEGKLKTIESFMHNNGNLENVSHLVKEVKESQEIRNIIIKKYYKKLASDRYKYFEQNDK